MSEPSDRWLAHWREQIEIALEQSLAADAQREPRLLQAMQYAVQGGGKRLRPLLALAACEACGGPAHDALPAAVALELIHGYSLVHDDLPAMDDATLRRGRPCTHVVHGEALGVLAGDALQTLAFERLCRSDLPAERVVLQVACLARASGVAGMAGGQSLDLAAESRTDLAEQDVAQIHRLKTGALLTAAIELGGLAAGATATQRAALVGAGAAMGLAFQIQDDLLDATGAAEELGKATGQDATHGKATWPAVVGLEASRAQVAGLTAEALALLEGFGPAAAPLRLLAARAATRRS